MKKICVKGFNISNVDKKVLEHYLLLTPQKWSFNALKSMIDKATRHLLSDWFDKYKETCTERVPADIASIISNIINLNGFKKYGVKIPRMPKIKRKEQPSINVWEGGFNVEDHEKMALDAYYESPEKMLEYLLQNKIYQRRKAFRKEYEAKLIKNPGVNSIPANEDDLINFVCSQAGYKNRKQGEEELNG